MHDTLPRHPVTGLSAVMWRKARPHERPGRYPVWPVLGGAEPPVDPALPVDPPIPPAVPPAPPAPPAPADDPALGPAGEKALAEWKQRAKDAEKASKEQAEKLKAFEDAQKTEAEKLADRLTAAEDRATKATRLAVAAKVEALASSRFQDPQDAVDALRPEDYIGSDGQVDADAIEAALADLLARKPHWATSGPRTPRPDPSQGARPGGTVGVEDRIREARAKGDWKTALHLENSKLAKLPTPK